MREKVRDKERYKERGRKREGEEGILSERVKGGLKGWTVVCQKRRYCSSKYARKES